VGQISRSELLHPEDLPKRCVICRKEETQMKIEVRKPTPEEVAEMQRCPIWEKEPSEFPWYYDEQETCLILEGDVTVEAPGQTVNFGPGDLVVFPKGLSCTWKVKQRVRKHYKFGD
jgi:uncharacterized cupin superfamily protein